MFASAWASIIAITGLFSRRGASSTRALLGPLLFVRARYGHGGRLGYASEWRAQPQRSGGGELIDQGVHLIDLARWFFGEFVEVDGFAHTYFWDMPVEDNGFMLLKTASQQVAFLHVSCTEWKNTFSWELYGRDGKLQVDGLGGSYGVERLTWYKDAARDGPAGNHDLGISDGGQLVDDGNGGVHRGHPQRPRALAPDCMMQLRRLPWWPKLYAESGYDHRA